MRLPTQVKIVEVGPRDGLQDVSIPIPTETKVALIESLVASGINHIETTSFVSPKKVPQMADHSAVLSQLKRKKGVTYSALVPNLRGLEEALSIGIDEIAVFGAASETFSQKNIDCSRQESLKRFEIVMTEARKNNIKVRGYISCVLGCPYEGEVPIQNVVDYAKALYHLGCYEISLGDTIGVGTPLKAQQLITTLSEYIPVSQLAIHFHDTYGQALANILACLEVGVATIDSAVAGLGGCPYAFGASGNVATEDLLYMLEGLGIKTGIDLQQVIKSGQFISNFLGKKTQSKVALVLG